MSAAPGPAWQLVHATCVALDGHAVLIVGPSGSGKSDLALRLIDQPGRGTGREVLTARLVGDDQVRISRDEDRLWAAAPPALAGLIEVRGLGIVATECAGQAELKLVVRLAGADAIERLPQPSVHVILGIPLPEIAIDPRSPSAPARLRAGLGETLRQRREIAT